MTRTQTSLYTFAVLAVGALLGYGAASGRFNSVWQAHAGTPLNSTGSSKPDGAGSYSDAVGKGMLLAKANEFETRQQNNGQPAKNGKQPNILVIMGDDIGWYNTSI